MTDIADKTDLYADRLAALQTRLKKVNADGVVLFPSTNLEYISGFTEEPSERHLLLFIPQHDDPVFLVPELSGDQIASETWIDDVRTWSDDENPTDAVAEIIDDLDLTNSHLLVDDTLWARFTLELRAVCPNSTFGLASEVLADIRRRKDEAERDALERAGEVYDQTMSDIRALGEDAIGLTEAELAEWIENRLEANGGTGVSFETIVGSGPNGAMPHHTHADREIEPGDPVVLDFGTRVDGYPSDATRTVVFEGEPDSEFRTVHEVVLEAQAAAVEAVEPGVTAGEIDAAARGIISDAGYGDQFIHRTGHGVGLDVHEEPYIVADSDVTLEPGMVFSVEPGIYLPDEFGVRIEDLVVVTADGVRRLNHADRRWSV